MTNIEPKKKKRNTWSLIPSILAAAACFTVLGGYLNINGYHVLQLSMLWIGALGGLAAGGLYAALSTLSPRLCRLNNLVLLNLFITLVGVEAILHAMQDRLPHSVVEMLPRDARERLMKNRGGFVTENIAGDKMLYAWKPDATFSNLPWLKVDANGYRNPSIPQSVNVVLLGDSVTIAQNSKHDMAHFLREKGVSVLNLGFSGYGPYQQRDAYQKYVLNTKISHQIVLINFCFCNDVTDAKSYEQTQRRGGTWKDYMGTTPSKNAYPFAFNPSWVTSIIFHLPFKAVQAYRNDNNKAKDVVINLPRGAVNVPGGLLPTDPQNLDASDWKPALTALADIIRRATSVGAQVVLAYYPNFPQLYMQGLPSSSPARVAAHHDYNDSLVQLNQLIKQEGGVLIDYTKAMQEGNAKSPVSSSNSDYHPNTLGTEIMAATAYPAIQEYLGN